MNKYLLVIIIYVIAISILLASIYVWHISSGWFALSLGLLTGFIGRKILKKKK